MSERLSEHEDLESKQKVEPDVESANETVAETDESKAETDAEKAATVEKLQDTIESIPQNSSSSIKRAIDETGKSEHRPKHPPNKALKKVALASSLTKIRTHLDKKEKAFSSFVHTPFINSISEVSAKTLIRPSGFFMGGLFTLAGSIYYFYATHQTGYKYNFLVAVLLFVGGFVIGLVLELVYNMLLKLFKSKA